jgi:hypothetical protein
MGMLVIESENGEKLEGLKAFLKAFDVKFEYYPTEIVENLTKNFKEAASISRSSLNQSTINQ